MKDKGRYDVSGSIEAQFEPGSNAITPYELSIGRWMRYFRFSVTICWLCRYSYSVIGFAVNATKNDCYSLSLLRLSMALLNK